MSRLTKKNELSTSAETSSRTKLHWTIAAALVYLLILVARVWGTHRFLHFEESAMVAASRSLSFGEVWNDNSYGGFIQRGLAEFLTLLALDESPMVLVMAAVLVSLACAMSIYLFLQYKKSSNFVALLAVNIGDKNFLAREAMSFTMPRKDHIK